MRWDTARQLAPDIIRRLLAAGWDAHACLNVNFPNVAPAEAGPLTLTRQGAGLVAAHDRVWARGMTITDPAHVAAAKVLREQFQRPRPAPDPHTELVRDLAEYWRSWGPGVVRLSATGPGAESCG